MSKAQKAQKAGGADHNAAEFDATTETPIPEKLAPSDRRANGSAKPPKMRKKSKLRAPARSAAENGDAAPALNAVPSVADLAGIVCRDPEKRRKRLKLAEAYRECSLDEPGLAGYSFGLVQKLSRNEEKGPVGVANAKLLLEVLKEVAHALEPPKTAGANEASDAPQFVRLIHNVPRPVRTE
jgi:hypothetical protein